MELIKTIFLLLVGFVLLIKASDVFVDAVSSIATHFKMSKMMIAVTVAAFGTCAPELAISFNSIIGANGDIAIANIIGSNTINILLIIGVAALISPIKIKNSVVKKELPILLVITSLFVLCLLTNLFGNTNLILTRKDGFLLLLFFLVFIFYIVSVIKVKEGVFERSSAKYKMPTSIILTIICCVLIIFASDLVVNNAQVIARMANVSEKIITMTIVVIGTSLPELTMTVISARKNEYEIAIGNIIGTNIFNICIVLGLPVLIFGGFESFSFNVIDILAVLIAAFVFYFFSCNDKRLSRREGIIMISIFLIYYIYIFFQ